MNEQEEVRQLGFRAKAAVHLVKRMFDECGTEKAEAFILRVGSGEHDVPSPWSEPAAPEAGNDREVPSRKVGCENEGGTLNIHLENETCSVCEPHPVSTEPELHHFPIDKTDEWEERQDGATQPTSAEPEKQEKRPEGHFFTQRGGYVTEERAKLAARRLINSRFNNPDQARASIPAHHDDDDLVLTDYLTETTALRAENARLEKELGMLREELRKHVNAALANAAKLEGK